MNNFKTYLSRLFIQYYCSIFSGKDKSLLVCVLGIQAPNNEIKNKEEKKRMHCRPVKKNLSKERNQKKEPMPKEKPK